MEADRLLDNADELDRYLSDTYGLSRIGYRILGLLYERGDLTMGNVSTTLGRSNGTMTAIVDNLEESGFVQRIRRSDDRRSISLHLLKPSLYLEARSALNDRIAALVS